MCNNIQDAINEYLSDLTNHTRIPSRYPGIIRLVYLKSFRQNSRKLGFKY